MTFMSKLGEPTRTPFTTLNKMLPFYLIRFVNFLPLLIFGMKWEGKFENLISYIETDPYIYISFSVFFELLLYHFIFRYDALIRPIYTFNTKSIPTVFFDNNLLLIRGFLVLCLASFLIIFFSN